MTSFQKCLKLKRLWRVGVKADFKVLGLSNWKMALPITEMERLAN